MTHPRCNLQKFLAGMVLAEMKSQSINQKQLADKAFMSEKQLSRMLSGKSAGSITMWDNLLRTLGVKIWPDVTEQ